MAGAAATAAAPIVSRRPASPLQPRRHRNRARRQLGDRRGIAAAGASAAAPCVRCGITAISPRGIMATAIRRRRRQGGALDSGAYQIQQIRDALTIGMEEFGRVLRPSGCSSDRARRASARRPQRRLQMRLAPRRNFSSIVRSNGSRSMLRVSKFRPRFARIIFCCRPAEYYRRAARSRGFRKSF